MPEGGPVRPSQGQSRMENGARIPIAVGYAAERTCRYGDVPYPCGLAGMIFSGMRSRRTAESAVDFTVAMVDSKG
jgi:hypothetical protein